MTTKDIKEINMHPSVKKVTSIFFTATVLCMSNFSIADTQMLNEFEQASHLKVESNTLLAQKSFNQEYMQQNAAQETEELFEFEEIIEEEGIQLSDYFYAGLGYGHTKSRLDLVNSSNRIIDAKDKGIQAYAGYRFTPYVSAELNYTDLGEVITSDSSGLFRSSTGLKTTALMVQGSIPLFAGLSGLIRAGLGYGDADFGVHEFDVDSNKTGVWGGGFQYRILDKVAVRLTYDYYNKFETDALMLSAQYKFGAAPVLSDEQVEVVESIEPIEVEAQPLVQMPVARQISAVPNLTTRFSQNVYFATNSSNISSDGYSELLNVVAAKSAINKIGLSGYADRRGSAAYNKVLSAKRVNSVKSYLVKKGFSAANIQTQPLGEMKSRAKTAAQLAGDRRVEIRALN